MPYTRIQTAFFVLAVLIATAPTAIAQDYLYVSSRGSHDVKRYDATTGVFVDTIIPAHHLRTFTQEVLFGPDGMLYVSFRFGLESGEVHRYDPLTGEDLGVFTKGYWLQEPTKMSWGPDGHLYISQWGGLHKGNVAVFDGTTGAFLRQATNEAQVLNLMDHAWDADGNLLVVSYGSTFGGGDVRRYDANGNFAGSFIPSSEFGGPVNIWFEENGDFMVLDWGGTPWSADAVRYDSQTGLPLQTVARSLQRAEGYAIGTDSLLYVGDWGQHIVNRYNRKTGLYVDTFISGAGLLNPNSLVFGPPSSFSTATTQVDAPMSFALEQNYPNPFNPRTQIPFKVDRAGPVTLEIFNMMGVRVATLQNGPLPAGLHERRWDAGRQPSGQYVYRLTAPSGVHVRVLTVLK